MAFLSASSLWRLAARPSTQIRHVDARNQQDEHDGANQHGHRRSRVARQLFVERHQTRVDTFVRWELPRETFCDGRHLSLRRAQVDSGFEPRDNVHDVRRAHGQFLRREPCGHPERGTAHRKLKLGRDDADDDVRQAVQENRAADDAGIGAEQGAPDAFVEHDDGIRVRLVVGWQQRAPDERLHAEHGEQIRRCPDAGQFLRIAGARQVVGGLGHGRHAGERSALLVPGRVVGRRRWSAWRTADRRRVVPHDHEAIRIGKRQRTQEHRAHEAEDRRVRADAECEHRDGDDRKRRGFAQCSHGIPGVLTESLQPGPAPHFSHLLIQVRDVAQLFPGGVPRRFRGQAALLLFLGGHCQMDLQLAGKVLFEDSPAAPWPKPAADTHGWSFNPACMTRAIALASCVHFDASRTS
jgi:hypothetical protein